MSDKENDMSAILMVQLESNQRKVSRLEKLKRSLYHLFIEPFEAWGWYKIQMAMDRADRRYRAAGRALLVREYPELLDDVLVARSEIHGFDVAEGSVKPRPLSS